MIKTKIVCTLGPAVDDEDTLRRIVRAGMDVARMNFSHGVHSEHLERLLRFRSACAAEGRELPVMMDTKGPEIRLGVFPGGEARLEEGQRFTLTGQQADCNAERACVSYPGLAQDVSRGDSILIDDGLIKLRVDSVSGGEISCVVVNSGIVSSRKGINIPGVKLNLPFMSGQDKSDLLFAAEHDFDFVAVSFTRSKDDILVIRRYLEENSGGDIKLIAKIENGEGMDNLEEIIRAADGIMVARGDLGVEIPVEKIPAAQKHMIEKCYRFGKPVITATQMLDSMIRNPRPTRAEVTDVANAIYDGTSAIMLSGETAAGKYPVEAVEIMRRIAETTEDSINYWKRFRSAGSKPDGSVTSAISHATCTTAMDLNAAAIVAVTTSGRTARHISSFRPLAPIIAATRSKKVMRQLRLSWGIVPVYAETVSSTDELFSIAHRAAAETGIVGDGDLVVITAGIPVGTSGTTNMLKVQLVGDVLCRGRGFGEERASGPVCIVRRGDDVSDIFDRGSILVTDEISDRILPLIRLSAGLVLDGDDRDGRGETLSIALGIPFVSEAHGSAELLKQGATVTVDAGQGIVLAVG